MSSEVSIAKPLSGSEALEACLHALRAALARDDRFQSHMSYTGFHATIDFKFYPQLSFIPPVERMVDIRDGDQSDLAESPTVDESITLPLRPPNAVRAEADMPTPVLVTDGQGKSTEKWVRRAPGPPSKSIPKNKVMGANQ